MPVVQSGRTPSGNARASTRSPLNVEISAKIPVRDLLGQCQATDWIGLRWAILWWPLGPSGTVCWWLRVRHQSFLPADWCLTRSYSANHRHFTTFGLWSRVGYRSARLVPHSLTQRCGGVLF